MVSEIEGDKWEKARGGGEGDGGDGGGGVNYGCGGGRDGCVDGGYYVECPH